MNKGSYLFRIIKLMRLISIFLIVEFLTYWSLGLFELRPYDVFILRILFVSLVFIFLLIYLQKILLV